MLRRSRRLSWASNRIRNSFSFSRCVRKREWDGSFLVSSKVATEEHKLWLEFSKFPSFDFEV